MPQARQVKLEAAIQSRKSQSQKDRCQVIPFPQRQLSQTGSYRQAVKSCLPGLGEWRNMALFWGAERSYAALTGLELATVFPPLPSECLGL